MKTKISLIILLSFILTLWGNSTFGQVTIFSEDFESWTTCEKPTSSWTSNAVCGGTESTDNHSIAWHRNDNTGDNWNYTSGIYSPGGANLTTYSARYHFYGITSTSPNTTLISPAIDLSSYSSNSLKFYYNNGDGTDNLYVSFSDDNGSTWGTPTTYGVQSGWAQQTISIPAGYNVSNFKIKFEGDSDYGSTDIGIDEILVEGTVSSPTLTITNVSEQSGNSVAVPVNALELAGLVGFQWTIEYDATKLTYVDCDTWDGGVTPASVTINSTVPGKLMFGYNNYPNEIDITNGTFFNINFTIDGAASGTACLSWSDSPTARELSDAVPEVISTTWVDGCVTILPLSTSLIIDNTIIGVVGNSVAVPVNALELAGLVGFQWTLDYDESKLTYVNCTNWDAQLNGTVTVFDNGSKLMFVHSNYTGDVDDEIDIASGKFFDVNFTIDGAASGTACLSWSDDPTARELSDIDAAVITPVTWVDGCITILPPPPTLIITDVTGVAGGLISVPVEALNISGLVGFQWTIDYDQTKLTFVDCTWDVQVNGPVTVFDNGDKLMFVHSNGATVADEIDFVSGTFFNINFSIIAGTSGTACQSWSDIPTARELSDITPAEITGVTWTTGCVTIEDAYNWNGSVSTDWQNPVNWTPNIIPISTTNAIIPVACPNYPVVDDGATTAECKDLQIDALTSVTIATNGQMTVSGTVTNTQGNNGFIIKSDATGDGSLITDNAIAATIERFVVGDQWHLIYPSLSAVPSTVFSQEGVNTNANFYSYTEPNGDYWNATIIYGTSGWTSVPAANLSTNYGYLYNRYGYGSKTFVQETGNIEVVDKTFDVSYTISTVTIENGVTEARDYFDGWNLAGNPYTSAVDWDAVTLNNIESGVYYFDGTNYKYYMRGGDGTDPTPYTLGITLNGGSQYIPVGQGFFVKAKNDATPGTFTIPKAARVHNDQAYFKSETVVIPDLLKINIAKGNFSDEMVVRSLELATDQHDPTMDAHKMFSWNATKPQIYSHIDNSGYPHKVGQQLHSSGVFHLTLYRRSGEKHLTEAIC